jgi:hypothetical protein
MVYIDGKVEGSISANFVELGPYANVCGDIVCKRIRMDGHACYIGDLNVSPSNSIDPMVEEEHLVIDDDQVSTISFPKEGEQKQKQEEEFSSNSSLNKAISPVKPKKPKALLFIHEPQKDFIKNSGKWYTNQTSPLEFKENDQNEHENDLKKFENLANWIITMKDHLDHIVISLDVHYVRVCFCFY